MKNYEYPVDYTLSYKEIDKVLQLWRAVELAYEESIETETFIANYRNFKTVIKSIGEEKRLAKQFEAVSGYSLYKVKQLSENGSKKIKVG